MKAPKRKQNSRKCKQSSRCKENQSKLDYFWKSNLVNFEENISKNSISMMEEAFLRFPHLPGQILNQLDNKSLLEISECLQFYGFVSF